MAPEIESAIKNPEVIETLMHKISRERVYKEFTLMMKGKNHQRSLYLLKNFGLLKVIFLVPEGIPDLLDQGSSFIEVIQRPRCDSNFILYSAGILIYYGIEEYKVKRNKKDVLVYEAICEDLKMNNFEISNVSGIIGSFKYMIEVLEVFSPLKIAEIIRRLKENWDLCLIIAAYFKYGSSESAENHINRVKELVTGLGIEQIWLEKPLLNVRFIQGNEIKNLLKVEGKVIGAYSKECLNWQVLNRNGTREELLNHLKNFVCH
jgi:tRNA nucleotidyltransferase/poly(A) polymerase